MASGRRAVHSMVTEPETLVVPPRIRVCETYAKAADTGGGATALLPQGDYAGTVTTVRHTGGALWLVNMRVTDRAFTNPRPGTWAYIRRIGAAYVVQLYVPGGMDTIHADSSLAGALETAHRALDARGAERGLW